MNAILKWERTLVSDTSGTTRDAIADIFSYGGKRIRLIDTAGIRRKNRRRDQGEIFSLQKSLDAINKSDVSLLVVSVEEGLTSHDKKIISYVVNRNKSFAIVVNKWDIMSWKEVTPKMYEDGMRSTFPHVAHGNHLPVILVSCLEARKAQEMKKQRWEHQKKYLDKTLSSDKINQDESIEESKKPNAEDNSNKKSIASDGMVSLLKTILKLIKGRDLQIKTTLLNQAIQQGLQQHAPPMLEAGRKSGRLKIYYAVQVDTNPLTIRLYINHKKYLTPNYRRYLENLLLKLIKMEGVFLSLQFVEKEDERMIKNHSRSHGASSMELVSTTASNND